MILTPEDRIRERVESKAWSRVTIDDLVRRGAAATPDHVAFEDVGLSPVPGVFARYSFAEAERRIAGLAAFLGSVGLKPDMVVGLHLPPCADAAIVTLAVIRAGLVAASLPLHWGNREIETAIGVAGIKAIVTTSSVEGEPMGERIRDVAGEVFAIRFVLAMGDGLPDGLIDLATVMAEVDGFGPPTPPNRRGDPADHVAFLSFARTVDDSLSAAPFSHSQLVAMADAHVAEGSVGPGERILVPLQPASLAGLAGGILTALAAGGGVAFHYALAAPGILDAARTSGADRVLAPAALADLLDAHLEPGVALSLFHAGLSPSTAPRLSDERPVVDLTSFGGLTLIPRDRPAGALPARLTLGAYRVADDPTRPILADFRTRSRTRPGDYRRSTTELTLSGALAPDAPWPEPMSGNAGGVLSFTSDSTIRTGLLVQVGTDGRTFSVLGTLDASIVVAGQAISVGRLEAMLKRHPEVEDAAVFAVPDPLLGSRVGVAVLPVSGKRPNEEALGAWLLAEGASVLERPAFVTLVRESLRDADGNVVRDALPLERVA